MTDHPTIVPPPELIAKWMTEARSQDYCSITEQVAYHAAQWGADQKLEAIIRLAGEAALPEKDRYFDGLTVAAIRAARRPKPPSLKEQALAVLEDANLDAVHYNIIRRALEDSND